MILPRDTHGLWNYPSFWRRVKDDFLKDGL